MTLDKFIAHLQAIRKAHRGSGDWRVVTPPIIAMMWGEPHDVTHAKVCPDRKAVLIRSK